jgi:hypothetical protein
MPMQSVQILLSAWGSATNIVEHTVMLQIHANIVMQLVIVVHSPSAPPPPSRQPCASLRGPRRNPSPPCARKRGMASVAASMPKERSRRPSGGSHRGCSSLRGWREEPQQSHQRRLRVPQHRAEECLHRELDLGRRPSPVKLSPHVRVAGPAVHGRQQWRQLGDGQAPCNFVTGPRYFMYMLLLEEQKQPPTARHVC